MQSNRPQGNIVVGQSGGPTSVINSSLVGVIDEARRSGAYASIIGAAFGVEGLLQDELIDLTAESPASLAMIRETPSAALGSNRYKLKPEDPEAVLDKLIALDARAFVYIGGNDSADTTHRLAQAALARNYPLQAIAVPKTVDNDLPETDHTPGYGSMARSVALAARDAGRDTEAMRRTDPIKLLETPGRNAGWVAAASALLRKDERDAPHLVYPPEWRIDLDSFLESVERAYRRRGFVVAVVAETLRSQSGDPIGQSSGALGEVDAFGHKRLVGAASFLCEQIAGRLGLRARWEKPGTLLRTSRLLISEVDLAEAYTVGQDAVRAALAGETDRMVAIVRDSNDPYRSSTRLVPLDQIANRERYLPVGYLLEDKEYGVRLSDEFLAYATPLIGGAIPEYGRLRGTPYLGRSKR